MFHGDAREKILRGVAERTEATMTKIPEPKRAAAAAEALP
jgi:hypothetical protein